jgi:hypothetical protein
MNVKLLATSALFIQSGAFLVSYNCFINFLAIVQCLAKPSLQSTAPGGTSKGIVNLNSAFEKADR